ncbi:hypothetical protein CC80DRAFT_499054 [Byssothecium circinans]|uniref:Uncharacterized protein n=1 Tax=Byssothecium circinans TaxID=147558 RepID=A0A6A5UIH6_9PLEO|nr:hypothetical protein CC80DRAFT_499054 [Byssothecium circinans]
MLAHKKHVIREVKEDYTDIEDTYEKASAEYAVVVVAGVSTQLDRAVFPTLYLNNDDDFRKILYGKATIQDYAAKEMVVRAISSDNEAMLLTLTSTPARPRSWSMTEDTLMKTMGTIEAITARTYTDYKNTATHPNSDASLQALPQKTISLQNDR